MTIEDGSRTYFDFKGKHMKKQKYRMDSGLYMTAHSFFNYINYSLFAKLEKDCPVTKIRRMQ